MPATLVAQVAWETLRYESGSVVDPELRETETDLLFSARTRSDRQVLFYVLLEHQSRVERWMALRLLRYVLRQLEQWRERNPGSERLPVIIPVVLYHGTEGAWHAPRRVEELFDIPEGPEWRALVPRFEFMLDDLTAERTEALMVRWGPAFYRLAMLCLRFSRSEEFVQRMVDWTTLFAELLVEPEGTQDLRTFVRYALWVGPKGVRAVTVKVLNLVMDRSRAEELMRTEGEELFEQGWMKGQAEGWVKGRAEGRAEDVVRILTLRGIRVDAQARQRILSCMDLATLDRWFERALSATSLTDVLDARDNGGAGGRD